MAQGEEKQEERMAAQEEEIIGGLPQHPCGAACVRRTKLICSDTLTRLETAQTRRWHPWCFPGPEIRAGSSTSDGESTLMSRASEVVESRLGRACTRGS